MWEEGYSIIIDNSTQAMCNGQNCVVPEFPARNWSDSGTWETISPAQEHILLDCLANKLLRRVVNTN